MNVTTDVNLGQLLITLAISLLGWGLRKGHKGIMGHLRRIDNIDDRLEHTAERVDEHSDIITRAGWFKGKPLRPVSRKRRWSDDQEESI